MTSGRKKATRQLELHSDGLGNYVQVMSHGKAQQESQEHHPGSWEIGLLFFEGLRNFVDVELKHHSSKPRF